MTKKINYIKLASDLIQERKFELEKNPKNTLTEEEVKQLNDLYSTLISYRNTLIKECVKQRGGKLTSELFKLSPGRISQIKNQK